MGCTPPEKRHTSIPAVNAVPKNTPSLSPRSSDKNNDNKPQIIPKLPSNESLKNKKKQSLPSNQHLHRLASPKAQRFSYQHQQSPQKPVQKQVIRVLSPLQKVKQRRVSEKDEGAKIAGVNSLDLLSWIKMPKENAENPPAMQKKKTNGRAQELALVSHNQEQAEVQTTAVFGRSKKWKEQALISELKHMNHQNFQRIKIDARKFQ